MGAGLSHAPIDPRNSRERYVFFSFPHIAIDEEGNLGKIYRPGRAGESAACGALLTALNLFQVTLSTPPPPLSAIAFRILTLLFTQLQKPHAYVKHVCTCML
jgi:hypothetical protein